MSQRRQRHRRPSAQTGNSRATRRASSHVQLYTQRAESAARTPDGRRSSERIAKQRAAQRHPQKASRPSAQRRQRKGAMPRPSTSRTPLAFWLPKIAAILVLVFLISWIRSCFFAPSSTESEITSKETVEIEGKWAGVTDTYTMFDSDYDYSKLTTTGLFYDYSFNGQSVPKGIDVSEHNSTIDWQEVKDSGISFAYLRIGYRGTQTPTIAMDKMYTANLKAATNVGIKLGVYFFSQATTVEEAKEEAQFVLDNLGDADISYPIAFDFEPQGDGTDRISNLTPEEKTAVAKAFCETINEGGYQAIIYGNQHDLQLYNLVDLASWGFWYAEYDSHPTYTIKYGIWQYSSEGTVPGIEGPVDLNLDMIDVLRAESA